MQYYVLIVIAEINYFWGDIFQQLIITSQNLGPEDLTVHQYSKTCLKGPLQKKKNWGSILIIA